MEILNKLQGELKQELHPTTHVIASIAIFMALYSVLHIIPISVYIGGAGFITLAIIFVPIVAYIFKPIHALLIAVGSTLIVLGFGLATAPVFGVFTFFMPVMAMGLGSIAFRHWIGKFSVAGWLIIEGVYYSIFGGTTLWLIPYFIVIILMLFFAGVEMTRGLEVDKELTWFQWFYMITMCYAITITELAAMNTLSIGVLLLPPPLWIIIFPVSVFERIVALVGSVILIKALFQRSDIRELLEY